MTRTRKKLRLDEFDRLVDDSFADEAPARQEKNGRRFEVHTRTSPPAQDELDELWNNVPL